MCLDMTLLYEIMYLMIAVMAIVLVPFMIFHYEAYDPESTEWQCWNALKYQTVTVIAATLTIVLMWLFLGFAHVPIMEYSYNSTLRAPLATCPAPDPCPDEGHLDCARCLVQELGGAGERGWFGVERRGGGFHLHGRKRGGEAAGLMC